MGVPDVTCADIKSAQEGSGAGIGYTNWVIGIIGGIGFAVSGIVSGLAAAFALPPPTLVIAATALIGSCLGLINVIYQLLDFLFHYKFACIDGERCAMGQVVKIEYNKDGDTTFDMKLAPIQSLTTVDDFKKSFQGSSLVYSDPGTATRGWSFQPENGCGVVSDKQPIPLFHCEIEGSYFNDWLTAEIALLWTLIGFAIAAIALAALELIPVIGWIIWGLMLLLILFGILLGIHGKNEMGSTSPDVPVGEMVPGPDGPVLTDAANNKVAVGDYIVLTGLHVLDCAHEGGKYCEIHPVRGILKIGAIDYNRYSQEQMADPSNNLILDRFCAALASYLSTDGLAATAQQPLEHPRIG